MVDTINKVNKLNFKFCRNHVLMGYLIKQNQVNLSNKKQITMKKIVGIGLIAALFIFGSCQKNKAPTCSITEPAEGEKIVKGSVYTLTGSAEDADGNLTSVGFYIDNSGVGSTNGINFSYDWDTDDVWVGNHTIGLIAVDDEGENATTYRQIEIIDSDTETDFIADNLAVMVGDTVRFSDLTLYYPVEWAWNFGDDNGTSNQNPYHIYNESGIYSVSLTTTNTAGSNTKTKTDYITVSEIGEPPIAGFSASETNIEEGYSVNFTDLSANSPTSWSWDFGDGGTSTGQNPSYTYNTQGTYTVQLTVSNTYGSASEIKEDFIIVSVGDIHPVADFTADQTNIGMGDTINFSDLSTNSPTSWMWDFGDGGTSTSQSPAYIYSNPGTYSVSLIVSNIAGSDTKTITDYVNVSGMAPVADFIADTTVITAGNPLNFTDLSVNAPTSWLWNFGDGSTSGSQNPSHTYNTLGVYTVSLTAGNPSGSDIEIKIDYIEVVSAIPDADFSADQTIIEEGQTINFTDLSTNLPETWAWDFGDGGSSGGQNPSYIYNTPGIYTVSLTSSNNAGSDTEIKTDYIVVNEAGTIPDADFVADETTVNMGNDIEFTDLSDNTPTSWLWDFGDGETSAEQNPVHTYLLPGIYSVSLTSENNYGSDTETKTDYITITGVPEADFTADQTTIYAGESVNFTDLSENSPTSWSWDFGDGTSQGQNPIYTFSTPGVYTVSLTVTNSYGSDTETKIDYIVVNPL